VDWSPFAWQGIQIETPRGWELGAMTGDRRKGYFRLDDAEMPRLEARWQSGPGSRLSIESVSVVADRYLKKARPKIEGQVERHANLAPPAGVDAEFFVTRGDVDALHMAARCRECGRVALLRALYRRDEPLEPVLRRIFSSYRDHAIDGKTPWALFGLRFQAPEEYSLLRHSLRAGRVELEFGGRRIRALAVRVGLAETVLRRESLLDWVKHDSAGPWPNCALDFAEAKRGEHAAISIAGRERSLARRILGRLRVTRGLAWHCDPANALYITRWFGREEFVSEFSPFSQSFLCHEP
jgi:hypothetical protein